LYFPATPKYEDIEFKGTMFVNTHNDDDIIGFAFGYQQFGHFFLLSWKKKEQTYWHTDPFRATAKTWMTLKVWLSKLKINGNRHLVK
jgi:syndecan 4